MRLTCLLALPILWFAGEPVRADDIRVAVASNFRNALLSLAESWEAETGHRVLASPGSTGKHFAQISHGAPFDAFFAADARHPELLEARGLAVAGSRFTYAIGKLVLWSPNEEVIAAGPEVLEHALIRHLAIANPALAPYGRAAQEVLQSLGAWQVWEERMLRAENVSQAYQFTASGNAELGFVAWSQLLEMPESDRGSWWLPPRSMYAPLVQQAVLLSESAPARDFLRFVRTRQARRLICAFGYDTLDVE